MSKHWFDEGNPLELEGVQLIDLPTPPLVERAGLYRLGIALDNLVAQVLIGCGLHVECDEGGPYLVTDNTVPFYPLNLNNADVKVAVNKNNQSRIVFCH